MRENLEIWFSVMQSRLNHALWFIQHVRGVIYDQSGTWYWRTEDEYSPEHFRIDIYARPGITYHSPHVGWIVFGSLKGEASYLIFDVKVPDRYRSRGIGTALVVAAISFTRKRKTPELRGFVTSEDAEKHPYLSDWYARLGFNVTPVGGATVAVFSMKFSD